MKILLKNFGNYETKEFNLPNNKFVLFKGENGSGKSTVFKAISWVLFNKLKTVKHGADACEVVFQDTGLTVKRVSKPQSLKLQYKNETFEHSVAQEMIYKIIGLNWDQFCLSTMIDSNIKTSLATITPTERFNVIRELVSTLDEPRKDQEKIEAYYKSLTSDIHKGELNVLERSLKESKIELEKSQDVQDIPLQVDENKEDVASTLKELRSKQKLWMNMFSDGLSTESIKARMAEIEKIPILKEKIDVIKECLQYARHMKSVQDNKDSFEKGKKLYFKELNAELKKLQKATPGEEEEELKAKAKECITRHQEKNSKNPFWDSSPEDIEELKTTLQKDLDVLKLKATKQKCPVCQEFIALQETQVVKWEKEWNKVKPNKDAKFITNLEFQYALDKQAKDKWETMIKNKMRINEIKRMLKDEILSSELIRLKKSFGEAIPIPKEWKDRYDVEYLEKRLEELTLQFGAIKPEEPSERKKLVSLKDVPTRKKLEKLNNEVDELEKKYNTLQEQEIQNHKFHEMAKLKDRVERLQKELSQVTTQIETTEKLKVSVARLKTLQKEAEILSMQNVVDTINIYSDEYLKQFFEENIRVVLSLVKHTAKETKLGLDIDIEFNGHKFDITEFSQGELIKINLSFILAMNRLQGSKYLFLDEVLQNLDRTVLLEIYDCLKKITDHVSIFVIDHNSVEGFFDEIVEFVK
jgi:DNA repair exonuclease SbcCD ATPase subunit